MIIPKAKQCDIEHGIKTILTVQDVLNEAKSAVTHVSKSGLQVPSSFRVLVIVAEELLLEHLALRRLPRGGGTSSTTGGDPAAANIPVLTSMEANPCIQVPVKVGLACKGQRPTPELLPHSVPRVKGPCKPGCGRRWCARPGATRRR